MDDDLQPDPYLALGVDRDAIPAAIKSTYRKLVLKCHPDKVTDESQKQTAADEFHKIQSAYELLSDEKELKRWHARSRLAKLRDQVHSGGFGRDGVEERTAAYRMPTEGGGADFYARGPERARGFSPMYEERRPSYVPEDYFDSRPRATSRKDAEYERQSKRTSPRDEREKSKKSSKDSKENERSSRKERDRRTDQDRRREREPKFATVEEDTGSDSDPYERTRRRMQEENELRRAREQFAETARRQREEAESGYFDNERARKILSNENVARDYMQRISSRDRPEPEPRPSAQRMSSSRDKVEFIKRDAGKPPVMIRRGSGQRPEDPRKSSGRDRERRTSFETVDDSRETAKRPPTLPHTKSSPADIRPPYERQRSYSVQVDPEEKPPMPQMKRAETMPTQHAKAERPRDSRRKESSKLREHVLVNSLPTPETSPEPQQRYDYGRQYADDVEYPTPDGYRTEVREPERLSRSPEPMPERPSKQSYASQRPAAPARRTTSTQYVYPGADKGVDSPPRPSLQRAETDRLFGEVAPSRSPRPSKGYSPPPESVRYTQEYRPEDVRMQTGYKSRRGNDRPANHRSNSSRPVSAR